MPRKQFEVLLDTAAAYNILDTSTAHALKLNLHRLPTNTFLRTISGGKLPITSKAVLPCILT